MKILSSFTHPQVFANLYEFLSSAEHKGTLTSIVGQKKKNLWKSMVPKIPVIRQNIFLCVRIETHTGLQPHEGE